MTEGVSRRNIPPVHSFISNVIIIKLKKMKEQDINELMVATIMASYSSKLKKKGSNVTPKKKKRKKNKKQHS